MSEKNLQERYIIVDSLNPMKVQSDAHGIRFIQDTNARTYKYKVDMNETLKDVVEFRLIDYNVSLNPTIKPIGNPAIMLCVNEYERLEHHTVRNAFYAIPSTKLSDTAIRRISYKPYGKNINNISIELRDLNNQLLTDLDLSGGTPYHNSFVFKITSLNQTS